MLKRKLFCFFSQLKIIESLSLFLLWERFGSYNYWEIGVHRLKYSFVMATKELWNIMMNLMEAYNLDIANNVIFLFSDIE